MRKYINYVLAITRAHLLRKNVPILVTLCVTNRCNLRCSYCYEEYYDRDYKDMSTDDIFQLIDELADMGTKYISVNGGEALLRPDLEDIIDKIKDKDMLCHLSTNGLLLRNNLSLARKIDSLAISIDGVGESHDCNRGEGTYKKVMETIEFLKKEGIAFHAHTVLTRKNIDAVDEMMTLAQQYQFQVQFSPLRVEDSPDQSIALSSEEVNGLVRKILDLKRQGKPVFFSREAYEQFLRWPLSYERQTTEDISPGYRPVTCYIKRFACHIEANGLVYPCVVLVNKFKALNFLEVGFKKSWEHLEENPCLACHNVCSNDLNLIFGLRLHSITNAAQMIWGRLTQRIKGSG